MMGMSCLEHLEQCAAGQVVVVVACPLRLCWHHLKAMLCGREVVLTSPVWRISIFVCLFYCVTRAPLLYFIRSWVALSFKVCQQVWASVTPVQISDAQNAKRVEPYSEYTFTNLTKRFIKHYDSAFENHWNHSKTSSNHPRSHQKFPRACIWDIFSYWASPK